MMASPQAIPITDCLSAFFPSETEAIHLRAFVPRGKQGYAEKLNITRQQLRTDKNLQSRLRKLNDTHGIYFVVNAGGDSDADVTRFNAFFAEKDDATIEEQHTMLDAAPISPSLRIETKKSVHAYWLLSGDCEAEQWREVQLRLIAYFKSDPKIKNPSRVMRVPGFDHVSADGSRVKVQGVQFEPSARFTVEQMLAAFPPVQELTPATKPSKTEVTCNESFATWDELNTEARRRMLAHPTCKEKGGWARLRGICHNGEGTTALSLNLENNAYSCANGCNTADILTAFGLPKKPEANKATGTLTKQAVQWPDPPDQAAFYGLAGDLVRMIEPHTEADPVGLLVQVVTAFGNVIGRNPYFVAEADKHYLNLFAVLVGNTSKGRKGTSWGQTKALLGNIDEGWKKGCITSGLSSGEGLIWAVRDPIEKTEPVREKNKGITGYQNVITDEGVADKRLLVVESEFASVLKVATREGNILSAVLRQAWDDGNLKTLTKNSPAKATDAHISIIGHITRDELRRYLEATESANGFANRFLWLCVTRSKSLPEGGQLAQVDFSKLTEQLRLAVDFAQNTGEIKRNQEARELWFAVYDDLSEGKAGMLGAVTSRAEAQVMRMACLYALLDCSAQIQRVHLEAALALWQYAENSARYIFGDAMGDPVADTILTALREAEGDGLTRTEISNLLGRNQSSSSVTRALASLAESGRIRSEKEKSDNAKRPTERWFANFTASTKLTNSTNFMAAKDTQDEITSLSSLNSSEASENQSQDKLEETEGWV